MSWLISGGCGFIGSNTVAALIAAGEQRIRVLDDLSTGSAEALGDLVEVETVAADVIDGGPQRVELVEGDIRDPDVTALAATGVDTIVHLAASTGVQPSIEDPRLDCMTNVIGTLNLLDAARRKGVRHFVFASSGGTVIGDREPPVDEEMVPHPKAPYGAGKAAGEAYCSAYAGTFGVHTVALRFSNVYGPRSAHKNSVVARFIQRAIEGVPLEIFGDGNQTRDFLYVDDLVRAIFAAVKAEDQAGEVFHIASGRETTIAALAAAVTEVLADAGIRDVRIGSAGALAGEIRRNFSTASKARERLGWHAAVPLETGLARTVEWFLDAAGRAA